MLRFNFKVKLKPSNLIITYTMYIGCSKTHTITKALVWITLL